ncbi:MAG: flagellar type III secretion system pore protein FliP [Rhodomicrobium sp.]
MSISRNPAVMARIYLGIAVATGLALGMAVPAAAQQTGFNTLVQEANNVTSARIVQLILAVTVLSVAPGILVMVTCFTRFIIALSFLRSGLGLPTTPANIILISLALFMTLFTMAPVFDKAWESGLKPYMDNKLPEEEAFHRVADPFRQFMAANVRQKDLDLFAELSHSRGGSDAEATSPGLRTLIPAFMISELRRGFEIGFLITLPFLVIDLITATLTMSMGMMMLSPAAISLPFKILFFILIDGWNLLIGGLVRSFH